MTDKSITFAGSLFEEGALSQQKSQRCGLLSTPGVEAAPHHSSGTVARVNQDRAFLCEPLFQPTSRKEKTPNIAAVGVLDGHGMYGEHISDFCATEVLACLRRHPLLLKKPAIALQQSIAEADANLGQHPEFKLSAISSGATACIAIIHEWHVFLCNVGDAACVGGRRVRRRKPEKARNQKSTGGGSRGGGGNNCYPSLDDSDDESDEDDGGYYMMGDDGAKKKDHEYELVAAAVATRRHTPNLLSERARILDAGGFVSVASEPGVEDARMFADAALTEGGLYISRALGAHGLRRVGLSCDADARELRVGTAPLQQPRRRTNGGENGAAGGTGRAGGNASGDDDDERDPIVIAPEERPFLIIATDGLWEVIEPQEAVSQLW